MTRKRRTNRRLKGYRKAYSWKSREDAEEHAKTLRRAKYGVHKRRVYRGVKVVKEGNRYTVYYLESKGYRNWLRTGKG